MDSSALDGLMPTPLLQNRWAGVWVYTDTTLSCARPRFPLVYDFFSLPRKRALIHIESPH